MTMFGDVAKLFTCEAFDCVYGGIDDPIGSFFKFNWEGFWYFWFIFRVDINLSSETEDVSILRAGHPNTHEGHGRVCSDVRFLEFIGQNIVRNYRAHVRQNESLEFCKWWS